MRLLCLLLFPAFSLSLSLSLSLTHSLTSSFLPSLTSNLTAGTGTGSGWTTAKNRTWMHKKKRSPNRTEWLNYRFCVRKGRERERKSEKKRERKKERKFHAMHIKQHRFKFKPPWLCLWFMCVYQLHCNFVSNYAKGRRKEKKEELERSKGMSLGFFLSRSLRRKKKMIQMHWVHVWPQVI